MDTYKTSKFILENIKPYLIDGAIICFDELIILKDGKLESLKL